MRVHGARECRVRVRLDARDCAGGATIARREPCCRDRMRRTLSCSFLILAACAAQPSEETGATSSALGMPPCGTPLGEVDGVYAYSNGADTDGYLSCGGVSAVGAYLYQCVELAQRYMNVRFGIAPLWPVQYASQMCASQPAGVRTHWVGDGYTPKRGDLAVWRHTTAGHVAVVRRVLADGVEILEENSSLGQNGIRTIAGSPAQGYGTAAAPIACFVEAIANTGSASSGSGANGASSASAATGACPQGDGLYCGGNGVSGDGSTLYRCTTGAGLSVVQACSAGCEPMPDGQDDRCRTSAACPFGAGLYCGGNGVSGDTSTLFRCGSGRIVVETKCAAGCRRMTNGANDACR
jgi:surface antigen